MRGAGFIWDASLGRMVEQHKSHVACSPGEVIYFNDCRERAAEIFTIPQTQPSLKLLLHPGNNGERY